MSTNPYKRLLDLLPQDPLMVGDVAATHADGTATVTLIGAAGQIRPRNPQSIATGVRVFVQGGQITGQAPSLPVLTIDI